jgi:hypothetical protein
MKYKNSRKNIVEGIEIGYYEDNYVKLMKDLLAQKEDRKEKSTFTRIERPTPSPLEIDEIEEISMEDIMMCSTPYLINKLQYKQCQLIRNQKKLYQLIKEKQK